jgi:molybdopterin-containing oxidoreductase family membrane subunit
VGFFRFLTRASRYALSGGRYYYLWLLFLVALTLWGAGAYADQLRRGLIVTAMRDQASWAFYIGNFTFLVGVATSAVILVIPAHVYQWQAFKEIAILGEILAISALVMAMLFVVVDVGRPEYLWHFIMLNIPTSLLAWDVVVLNVYFFLNVVIVFDVLYCQYRGQRTRDAVFIPLVLLSIPAGITMLTVEAFIYNGLIARPFWNSSILAPRFLASAFCSGPAILLILFQILQRTTKIQLENEAIWKIAELMAYAMFVNLFLFAAETFKEVYSKTEHMIHFRYLFLGIDHHRALVPYAWASIVCSMLAFLLLLIPATRKHWLTMNLGCLLIYSGVYIEKGIGLVMPGLTPDTLGEIYVYVPTMAEVRVSAGVFAIGFLVYTILTKVAVGILVGDLHWEGARQEARVPLTRTALT